MRRKDEIQIADIPGGLIKQNLKNINYDNEIVQWKDIKINILDHQKLLNQSIKINIYGFEDGNYNQSLDISAPFIFHNADSRSLFYESTLSSFRLPSFDDMELKNTSIKKGDTLYVRFDQNIQKFKKLDIFEGFKLLGFNSSNNRLALLCNKESYLKDAITSIKLDRKYFYRLPEQVIYEIRAKSPSSVNYTLLNNIYYAELDFDIPESTRYAGLKGEQYILPAINMSQNSGKILKANDRISFTFKSPVTWDNIGNKDYSDSYMTFESISEDLKTLTFKVINDLDLNEYSFNKLSFIIDEPGSFGIKINAKVASGEGYWSNNYIVDIQELDVGNTKYDISGIVGFIRSRPFNWAPDIIIYEGEASITKRGDQIKLKIFSDDIKNLSWDIDNYSDYYFNLNKEKSNGDELVLNLKRDIPDNTFIRIKDLKINQINQSLENEPTISLQISNNSSAHKKLNRIDKSIDYMKGSSVYVDFKFPDKMYANDYDSTFKNLKNDTINIILKNYNPNINIFWKDDLISIYLPENSGAKWAESDNILNIKDVNKIVDNFFLSKDEQKIKNKSFIDIINQRYDIQIDNGVLIKGNNQQSPFNLEYSFWNNIKSNINHYSQDHYNQNKSNINQRFFYQTSFDIDKDFYVHSELVHENPVLLPSLNIKNLLHKNDAISECVSIYFSVPDIKFETFNLDFETIDLCNSDRSNYLSFEVNNLFENNQQNNFSITPISIRNTNSKYFEIGKVEEYHLNINYDGHYFKSDNLLKMAHPELNVESSILKWPADQIKTGRIQVKDSNTGFVNYDTLYIKIPESIDSRIIWSDNQNINQKYKIHHSLVGDKKVDNRIIAIYNDNKKDMVVNPLLMNGLANFEDIGINGILIDFEFSFDNNGNYIERNCASEVGCQDGDCSCLCCNQDFLLNNCNYNTTTCSSSDVDIQRIESFDFIFNESSINSFIYDQKSPTIYLPDIKIKENNRRSTIKKGESILLKLGAAGLSWKDIDLDNEYFKISSFNSQDIVLALKKRIPPNNEVIISGLELKNDKLVKELEIQAFHNTDYGNKIPIKIGEQSSFKIYFDKINISLEDLEQNLIYTLRDAADNGGAEYYNYFPRIILDNNQKMIMSKGDTLRLKFPDELALQPNQLKNINFNYLNSTIDYIFSETSTKTEIGNMKFFYPDEILENDLIKYQIINSVQKYNKENYIPFNNNIVITTGQPLIYFNNKNKFIIDGDPILLPSLYIHPDPYLNHIKKGTILTLKIKEGYPIRWSDCNNSKPRIKGYNINYSYKDPERKVLEVIFNQEINSQILLENIYIENFESSSIVEDIDFNSDFIEFYLSSYDIGYNYEINFNNQIELNNNNLKFRENFGYSNDAYSIHEKKNNGIQSSDIKIKFKNKDPLDFENSLTKTLNPFKIIFNNFNLKNLPDSLLIDIITEGSNQKANSKFYWDILENETSLASKNEKKSPVTVVQGKQTTALVLKINKEYWDKEGEDFNGEILIDSDNLKIKTLSNKLTNKMSRFHLEIKLFENNNCSLENRVLDKTYPITVIKGNQNECDFTTKEYPYIQENQEIILTLESENNKNKLGFAFDFKPPSFKINDGSSSDAQVAKFVASKSDTLKFVLLTPLEPGKKYKIDNINFEFLNSKKSGKKVGEAKIKIDIGGNQFFPKKNTIKYYEADNRSTEFPDKISDLSDDMTDKFLCLFNDDMKLKIDQNNNVNKKGNKNIYKASVLEFSIKEVDNKKEDFEIHIAETIRKLEKIVEGKNIDFSVKQELQDLDKKINRISKKYESVGSKETRLGVSKKYSDYHLILSVIYSMKGDGSRDNDYADYASMHFTKSGKKIEDFNSLCITSSTDDKCSSCCYPINPNIMDAINDIYATLINSEKSETAYIEMDEKLYKLLLNNPDKNHLLNQIQKEINQKDIEDDESDYDLKYASIHSIIGSHFNDFEFINIKNNGLYKHIKKMKKQYAADDRIADFSSIFKNMDDNWSDYMKDDPQDWDIGETIQGQSMTLKYFDDKDFAYLKYNYRRINKTFKWTDFFNLKPDPEPVKLNILSDNIFYDKNYNNRYNVEIHPDASYDDNSGVKLYSEGSYLLLINDINQDAEKLENDKLKLNIILGLFLGSMALGAY